MNKISVAVLCGGQSAEHEVSLRSAANVVEALSPERFRVTVVGIDKQGVWRRFPRENFLLDANDPKAVRLRQDGLPATPVRTTSGTELLELDTGRSIPVDVLFPVLHGTNGEDGTIQGLAKMLQCPCVGSDLAASANCMDKQRTKTLLQAADLPTARGITVEADSGDRLDRDGIIAGLGLPLFVKPARLGSSIGISKVKKAEDLHAAVQAALRFDSKILIEEYIAGREIECAVLGNRTPEASVPGEIVPLDEWYSYDAKYVLEDGARLVAPAPLESERIGAIREMAVRAYQALGCAGMARVDFFLRPDGSLIINEINTIPGFTSISMYPRLWQLTGISYAGLVERLIDLALEYQEDCERLAVDYRDA